MTRPDGEPSALVGTAIVAAGFMLLLLAALVTP